ANRPPRPSAPRPRRCPPPRPGSGGARRGSRAWERSPPRLLGFLFGELAQQRLLALGEVLRKDEAHDGEEVAAPALAVGEPLPAQAQALAGARPVRDRHR